MSALNKAANYHEVLKADFMEHFEFVDQLRVDMDVWEKEQLKSIIKQGIDSGVFEDQTDKMDVLLDVFIMVFKGLEILFFLQGKYDALSPHFDDLIQILIKGISV